MVDVIRRVVRVAGRFRRAGIAPRTVVSLPKFVGVVPIPPPPPIEILSGFDGDILTGFDGSEMTGV